MIEASLKDILLAREDRIRNQQEMIREFGLPLISFTMNIAGPVKNTPLIKKAFETGAEMLESALSSGNIRIASRLYIDRVHGLEALYSADAAADVLKSICMDIEEGSDLGRLFDMDVIDTDGIKIERPAERSCLICGTPGRGCASRRVHSVEELQKKTGDIIIRYFAGEEAECVSQIVTAALIEEVLTTPKPGLVDGNNNGSHSDMDIGLFIKSAESLRPYWKKCFETGAETAGMQPELTFRLIRQAGIEAEEEMLRATGGVNTHKGAIFLLGTACGAAGRLFDPGRQITDAAAIADECARMTESVLSEELEVIKENPEKAGSSGEKLWVSLGLKGARGEAMEGLRSVTGTGLPVFRRLLSDGMDRNDAGAATLITLIALGRDTNMIKRGGYEKAQRAASAASELIRNGRYTDIDAMNELDRAFISENLSPGGCADLLSMIYFLHDYTVNRDIWKAVVV